MNLIYFALVLSIVVFIHELGHYIFAKKAKIYVHEFSIGMGPKIFSKKFKNDETTYSIRLLPIGGFVQMAGENEEDDKDIPAENTISSKSWFQKASVILAGVVFNFILAIIIFITIALFTGAPDGKAYIVEVSKDFKGEVTKLKKGDMITSLNGKKLSSIDMLPLELQVNGGKTLKLGYERNSKEYFVSIKPVKIDGAFKYGFSLTTKVEKGFINAIKYGFKKVFDLIIQMFTIIIYLFTGKLSVSNLAGPVGIFNIVADSAKAGFLSVIYLIAFLSVNVGVINLLPFPAFDGGRFLFLLLEGVTRKKISPKLENTIHAIGFVFLMVLMVYITFNDIFRLFK